MAKRLPTLADRFVANSKDWPFSHPDVVERVRGRMRSARRFVMDDQASLRYAEVVRDVPDLILREQMFARAPYDITWVEFNFRLFWETVNRQPAEATSDKALGFLIDHGTAYVISQTGLLMPLVYDLHQPWEIDAQQKFCDVVEVSRIQLDVFLWGSSYHQLSADDRRLLRSHHSARLLPFNPHVSGLERNIAQRMFNQSIADLRNIIAILLLLNRPSVVRYVRDEPHHRGFIGGKLRSYMAHTLVTIDVDPKPIVRLIGTAADAQIDKRRHEVRGTYCHDEAYRQGQRAGCIHTWMPHPKYPQAQRVHVNDAGAAEQDNWLCSACQGHRWWRDQHVRGNALRGFVGKDYRATSG